MLNCTLRNKPGRGDLAFEDALTATVFERLAYLEPHVALRLLFRACPALLRSVGGSVERFRVDLWPMFADATHEQLRVEPDAVIDLGVGLVVVEAKRPGGGQRVEQIRREVASVGKRDRVLAVILVEPAGAEAIRDALRPLPVAASRWADIADAVLADLEDTAHPPHVRAVLHDILRGLAAAGVRALRPLSHLGDGLAKLDGRRPVSLRVAL